MKRYKLEPVQTIRFITELSVDETRMFTFGLHIHLYVL